MIRETLAAAMISVALGAIPTGPTGMVPPPAPREHQDDPPARHTRPLRLAPPPSRAFLIRDQAVSVQVNTSAGMNILGDAANEPSIVVDPGAPNRLAIGWRQFDSVTSNFRQAGNACSRDGGRTWTVNPPIEPGIFRTDPVLRSDAAGKFFYNSYNAGVPSNAVQVFTSIDAGKTWANPVQTLGGDKVWMAIDTTGGIGNGNVYQIWNSDRFNRSVNAGASFQYPMAVPGLSWVGTVTVGVVGEVFAVGLPHTVFRSINAQNPGATPTFAQAPVNMGGPTFFSVGNGPNPSGGIGQVWLDVDRSSGPRRGWIYQMAAVDPSGPDPLDITIAHSADGGLTWSPPVTINNDGPGANHWQWFNTLGVAPNGRLDVVWNDTRNSNQVNWSEVFYAWSDDGGQTWQGNTPVTQSWNSFVGWPNQNKIGDYYDIQSDRVGAFVAYAATFNNEQDVYFMRIGDYDCNGNGVPDPQDIASGTSADCNGNGIPDSCEIAAGTLPDANHNGVPDPCECYANCDGSAGPNGQATLNVNDFICFQTKFALADLRADCDGNGSLNINDFICFQTSFALGCP